MRPISVIDASLSTAALLLILGLALRAQAADPNPYPKVNLADGYQVEPHWPHRPPELSWGDMPGIAVDGQDQIWTFTRSEVPIQVYTPQGKLVRSWGKDLVGQAHHLRIDRQGHVWLADAGLHVVHKFTPEGKLLLTLGVKGEAGDSPGRLNRPTDMAITASGDIFVSDGYGNNRVVHFDSKGRFVKAFGKLGTAPGEFSLPHSIATDSSGRLYVADRNNARIQVLDQQGRFLEEWSNLLVPWGLWVTPDDQIYACGSSAMVWGEGNNLGVPPKDQIVMRFTPQGKATLLWTFPKGQDGQERPGELNWVHAVALDSLGNLYLGDIVGRRAQKFAPIK